MLGEVAEGAPHQVGAQQRLAAEELDAGGRAQARQQAAQRRVEGLARHVDVLEGLRAVGAMPVAAPREDEDQQPLFSQGAFFRLGAALPFRTGTNSSQPNSSGYSRQGPSQLACQSHSGQRGPRTLPSSMRVLV